MTDACTTSPMDFSRLRETSEGDLDFEREVLDIYFNDTRGRIGRLREEFDTNNVEEIRRLAHTIKGASASIGATVLSALAAKLERQAAMDELGDGPSLLGDLEEAYAATVETVEHHLSTAR